MSFEIVYTSARRGLRIGASGYCTVAETKGIPRALREKMESLSGSATAGEDHVTHSHTVIRIQRKPFHVLSRIGDAGRDHTGRSNKIAHHLALTPADVRRFRAGPVSCFENEAFWFRHWRQDPQYLSADRLPDMSSERSGQLTEWRRAFGDPAYAAELARAGLEGTVVNIVVPDGTNALDLAGEAMRLLTAAERWRVNFSTHFLRSVTGAECHWRFVPANSAQAKRLPGRGSAVVVAPGSELPLSENHPLIVSARSGRPVRSRPARTERETAVTPAQTGEAEEAQPAADSGRLRPSQLRRRQAGARARAARTGQRKQAPQEDVHTVNLEALPTGTNRKRRPLLWLAVVVTVVGVGIGIFLAVRHFSRPKSRTTTLHPVAKTNVNSHV